jgi:hypothetical protein
MGAVGERIVNNGSLKVFKDHILGKPRIIPALEVGTSEAFGYIRD